MADHDLRHLPSSFLELDLADEAATRLLANDIAMALRPRDTVCLSGDLGAGKSTFTRALLRAFAGDPDLEVPSPTFTLVQTYAFDRFDLSHFDLYRLEEPEEIEELGLDDLLETGAALIEWPEKAEELLPSGALWIQISQPSDNADRRRFRFFSDEAAWQDRINQTLAARAFLRSANRAAAERQFLAGDASLRGFETIAGGDATAVLMLWPFQGDRVPSAVRAYMQSVHLARDCRAVAAIGSELRRHGFQAPEIYAADLEAGYVLSQDLGAETIVAGGKPVPERYHVAVDILARMHGQAWPDSVPVSDGTIYQVSPYSHEALVAEASLFTQWHVPHVTGAPLDKAAQKTFETLWHRALEAIADAQSGWVLRDFHSPNLLWQEGAAGTDRIGLIDFQDTVIGPVAYDVASLLLDARTDISEALESELFDAYVSARKKQSSNFDQERFSEAYAVMAAQRITKILGIFVRLAKRDGKPAYLSHLPRMLGYLDRVLDRPVLSDLKDWYARFRP
ncbi:tRNA (adenosine(37)-N6)-threonylcarbamoyltransferase complex ATPase subunit type 1 TsaE [Roseibium sediminicola]|uniref:tRNA threonylcarbamoyladenosine biosynthesis protein TsaE n=1 Tax=Roseibium sediminicola TaxID=2933272 RepID=A0ABT0GVF3_9HYPH|nr:tRNA (adenosine(37)-N6)-threonylcarbamoyltransferase complex ATPase subunit type 1 TsaE [Roseibium sp. CAU 1639]MCK7613434.1 tRNA (adenosine(37)-N6)-threonylcarbamoyltransferase complex ATPase subunit type 1 TsaE [Roseibium sp. CAU 1639]